jgi:alpha-tubulin suppressor-like RCC1 family protein
LELQNCLLQLALFFSERSRAMRKLTRNLASVLMALAIPLAFAACSGDDEPVDVPVATLTLPGTLDLTVGTPKDLTATMAPDNATNKAVTWTSSNQTVVVNPTGTGLKVTLNALDAGETIITVTSNADATKTASCTVTVTPAPASVAVAPATLKLLPDATGAITAIVRPPDAGQAVTWTSDNMSVATVVGNGLSATVTAVAVGTARITATATGYAAVFGVCDVTVAAAPTVMPPTTLAAGYNHSLGIKENGALCSWGTNNYGQLGDGTFTGRSAPGLVADDTGDWVAVSSGYEHTAAIKTDGSVWSWGWNMRGQLGLGDDADRNIPVKVGTDTNWVAVSANGNHTVAIKADGSLWIWGWNESGQLGLGDLDNRYAPARVGTDADWVAASAGYYHTVAIKSDGSIWAWGSNEYGQLGLHSANWNTPQRVGTANDWAAVATGAFHTQAIKADGSLWTCGYNGYGQLGLGGWSNRYDLTRVGATNDWVAMSTSYCHTAVVKADGSLWAWGYNIFGQLGLGHADDQDTPQRVGADNDWAAAACGRQFTLAVKGDGALWACGFNASGQLGLGSVDWGHEVFVPVATGWRVPAK